jgi:hypothetical protein
MLLRTPLSYKSREKQLELILVRRVRQGCGKRHLLGWKHFARLRLVLAEERSWLTCGLVMSVNRTDGTYAFTS